MKLWQKIFIYSFILFELVFIVSTVSFVEYNFNQNLKKEINRGLSEQFVVSSSIQAIDKQLGGQLASAPDLYKGFIGAVLKDYARYFETQGVFLEVLDENNHVIFNNFNLQYNGQRPELEQPMTANRRYIIRDIGQQSFLYVASQVKLGDNAFKVTYIGDITGEYKARSDQFVWLLKFNLIIALWLAAGLYILTRYLTRPVRSLIQSAQTIAGGDYSDRVKVESKDEIGVLGMAFNQMAKAVEGNITELERGTEIKQRFIENLTHELKTPLTSIIGYADFLRSTAYNEKVFFESLDYIYSEGKRLETLSAKLMDLILLEKQELATSRQNIAKLCCQVENILKPRLKISKTKLTVKVQPCQAIVEPDLFKIMLTNLLDNAIKASPEGSSTQLNGYLNDQGELVIEVVDQGIGISEADIPRVFEPFFMVDKSRTRSQQGAGLGLAICAEIVKLHSGKITITSQLGLGTKVMVAFP